MSEIKALDKLRVSEDAAEYQWIRSDYLNQIADDIEAEIAANCMLLPVDADGVPIHVGDEMTCHGDVFKVCAVAPAKIHRWVTVKLGEPQTTYSYDPAECTHYKPRTLEDVLNDRINDVLRVMTSGIPIALETALNDSFGEECADEIRELLLDGDE